MRYVCKAAAVGDELFTCTVALAQSLPPDPTLLLVSRGMELQALTTCGAVTITDGRSGVTGAATVTLCAGDVPQAEQSPAVHAAFSTPAFKVTELPTATMSVLNDGNTVSVLLLVH